jgi:hypothetical protein
MNDNDPSHGRERGPARAVAVQPKPEEPKSAVPGQAQRNAALPRSLAGSLRSGLAQPEVRQTLLKSGFVAALLVVGGLLVWLLTSLLAGATMQAANRPGAAAAEPSPAPAAASPRPSLPLASVSPLDFRVGDCLKDFDPEHPSPPWLPAAPLILPSWWRSPTTPRVTDTRAVTP